MTKKGEKIQTHYQRLTVTVELKGMRNLWSDGHITEGAKYPVLATYIHRCHDGDMVPAFMIEADGGQVRSVACSRCTVVKRVDHPVVWQDVVNRNRNAGLWVGWNANQVYVTLTEPRTQLSFHFYGLGDTVQEAFEALNADLNHDQTEGGNDGPGD